MPVSNAGCYLCFWPTGCKPEVPTTPSVGSLHLLEQLIDLRKPVHSLATGLLQRILQDTDQQPDDKIYRAIRSQAAEPLSLWSLWPSTIAHGSILASQAGSFLNSVLLGFYGSITAYAWLIKSLAIGGWFNLHPLSLWGRDVWGLKFQPSNHMLVLQALWVLVPKSSR